MKFFTSVYTTRHTMANFFPRWTNYVPLKLALCAAIAGAGVIAAFWYYATPDTQRVGYMPAQPIPYNHELHVQQLGLDCRYCHSFVEQSGHANISTANTCWNCHQHVKKDSPKLASLRRAIDETYADYDGKPIEWVRVHRSPDYAYFNHSAHVNRGVSCESCHGDVHEMEEVFHAKSLTMGFCLDCHREPEKNIRPLEEVYNLDYDPELYLSEHTDVAKLVDEFIASNDKLAKKKLSSQEKLGHYLKDHWKIAPKESCSTCHR